MFMEAVPALTHGCFHIGLSRSFLNHHRAILGFGHCGRDGDSFVGGNWLTLTCCESIAYFHPDHLEGQNKFARMPYKVIFMALFSMAANSMP
jgi:hypothetical protein